MQTSISYVAPSSPNCAVSSATTTVGVIDQLLDYLSYQAVHTFKMAQRVKPT